MVRKTVHISISDDMFSTYAPKTYMENMPCELAVKADLDTCVVAGNLEVLEPESS